MGTQRSYSRVETRRLRVASVAAFALAAIATLGILLGPSMFQSFRSSVRSAAAAAPVTTHLSLDIMAVKPGGPGENWPAYIPTSSLTVPAHSLVTVTIRNFDLGDATMPADSPLLKVEGTVGGAAAADGQAYRALGATKVAHTFTIARLGINVPIPGDATGDQTFTTVTFQFRTGSAGTYVFQCFAPCGTGSNGFGGPMASMAYMQGTLTVQA